MDMFYKGYKFSIEPTGVAGGIYITHGNQRHIVERTEWYDGHMYADIHSVSDELTKLIDSGEFESIKQIPQRKWEVK